MATAKRVLATGPLDDYANSVLEKFGELVFVPDTSESTLLEWMEGAVVLAVRGVPTINAAVINRSENLKIIGRTGVGYNNIDIAAATERRIPVVYTPGAGARAVAEASMAYMLALTKKVVHWDQQLKADNWKSRYEAQGGDLDGATLGIVGLGRIGQILASMANAFEMRILAFDPFVNQKTAHGLGIQLTELDDLLAQSDFVCLHCAQTEDTTGLINRERLDRIKRGAFLINLARGGVVDNLDVLHEALNDGRLAGVALDVFEPEPPDVSHPIFQSERCLFSPHAMAQSQRAMKNIMRSMADDIATFFRGERPRFVVNPEVLD